MLLEILMNPWLIGFDILLMVLVCVIIGLERYYQQYPAKHKNSRIINKGKILTDDEIRGLVRLIYGRRTRGVNIVVVKDSLTYLKLFLTKQFRGSFVNVLADIKEVRGTGGYYTSMPTEEGKKEYIFIFEHSNTFRTRKHPDEKKIMFAFVLYHELQHRNQARGLTRKEFLERYRANKEDYEDNANEVSLEIIEYYNEEICDLFGIPYFSITYRALTE